MSIPGDFITLHRQAMRSWLWDMPADQGKVALTLLMLANWCEGKTFSGGKLMVIKRGQVMTSLPKLAGHARVSVRTVRTALKNLGIAEFLTDRATAQCRVITILNYDEYQIPAEFDRQTERQESDRMPTDERQDTDRTPTPIEDVNTGIREEGKKGGARKRSHSLPDSWQPNDVHAAKASEDGTDIEAEAESFRDHHLAKGSTMKDWDRAFNTWLRNAKKFAERDGTKGQQQPPTVYL